MGRNYFRPAHRDAAEPDIIAALRKVGATVWQLSGKDIPDLLVGYKGQTVLLEVKTPDKSYTDKRNGKTYRRDGALSAGQKAFFDSWRGAKACEVFTPEEALMAVGAPVEGVLQPLEGHRITPAYQKAQTADVVPKRRKQPNGALLQRCECGHERGMHASAVSICQEGTCPCDRFAPMRKK